MAHQRSGARLDRRHRGRARTRRSELVGVRVVREDNRHGVTLEVVEVPAIAYDPVLDVQLGRCAVPAVWAMRRADVGAIFETKAEIGEVTGEPSSLVANTPIIWRERK